jgi:hypothetical protein
MATSHFNQRKSRFRFSPEILLLVAALHYFGALKEIETGAILLAFIEPILTSLIGEVVKNGIHTIRILFIAEQFVGPSPLLYFGGHFIVIGIPA